MMGDIEVYFLAQAGHLPSKWRIIPVDQYEVDVSGTAEQSLATGDASDEIP
jgi:hypothetical protein